ncbi:oxidoreductase [Chromohalobacter sp. 296-RDG]|uniref:oxidoreductase n=1 Tax=Chromohalobacter sp. 296-RDG TaxID=2994062 RepID=UPI0024683955|nr:oxidoreductase [Chromohalobacter sp. 296-RDG]
MSEDRHTTTPLAVVTGATAGLGLETAKGLAAQGYRVIVTARNVERGELACHAIRVHAPHAEVHAEPLDLDSLESVRDFARRLTQTESSLERLINNAGIMALPRLERTRDGFERQWGINYLGHFLLTSELLPLLTATTAPRVVQLSSLAHRGGRIAFDDLNGETHYDPWRAYRQSKLAMLLFAQALQKHSDAQDWGLKSLAAHPGLSRTALFDHGVKSRPFIGSVFKLGLPLISQSAAEGARPTLHAALSDRVGPGDYIGPDGIGETRGAPKVAHRARNTRDSAVEKCLWDVSCELTGARWDTTAPA